MEKHKKHSGMKSGKPKTLIFKTRNENMNTFSELEGDESGQGAGVIPIYIIYMLLWGFETILRACVKLAKVLELEGVEKRAHKRLERVENIKEDATSNIRTTA